LRVLIRSFSIISALILEFRFYGRLECMVSKLKIFEMILNLQGYHDATIISRESRIVVVYNGSRLVT
jgi:hypothetical protein